MSEADDRLALQCGHVFHQHCIQSYADVKSMHILDLQCPNCKATSHDIRQREETLIVQSVGDETSDAAAGDMAATEAAQTDQDTGDAASVAATAGTQNDQDMGDAAAGALAATEAAQHDQDAGDATDEGAATEAAQNDEDTDDAQHEPEADIDTVASVYRVLHPGMKVRNRSWPFLVRRHCYVFAMNRINRAFQCVTRIGYVTPHLGQTGWHARPPNRVQVEWAVQLTCCLVLLAGETEQQERGE